MAQQGKRRYALWVALAFVAVAFAAYRPVSGVGFFFDDEPNILRAPALHWKSLSFANVRAVFEEGTLTRRPVANLSFALNHLAGGLVPRGYHWVNVFIHVGVGVALAWVCWLLCLHSARDEAARRRAALLSVVVGGVFLVHPLATQAVTYVVQRMTALAALFSLLAFALYVRGRMRAERRAWAFAGALICWLLALGSKEIAVCMPAVVVLYELCYRRDGWRAWLASTDRRVVAAAIAGAVACVAAGLWVLAGEMSLGAYQTRTFTGLERVLTQPRVHMLYLSLFFWPAAGRLSLEHGVEASTSLLSPVTTLFAALAIAAAFAAAAWLVWRRPRWGFPLAAYLVAHMLESLPIGLELVFEHRMYLPMAFLLLALAPLLAGLSRRHAKLAAAVVVVASVAMAVSTYRRNTQWADGMTFMVETAKRAPTKFRPWYNLGVAYALRGDYAAADGALRHALEIKPGDPFALNELGNACRYTARGMQALGHYRAALEHPDADPVVHYNLGTLLMNFASLDEAEVQLRIFVDEAPPALATWKRDAQQRLQAIAAQRAAQ